MAQPQVIVDDPILPKREVMLRLGISSRTTLNRFVRRGLLPTGFQINERGDLGWRLSWVMELAGRMERGEIAWQRPGPRPVNR